MKKIFLYLNEDWREDESAASFFLTDQLSIEFSPEEVFILTDDDVQNHAISMGAGVEAYTFIFSNRDIEFSYKGVNEGVRYFDSFVGDRKCKVSGHWDSPNVVVQYVMKGLKHIDDESLLEICLGDVADAGNQYAYIGAVKTDYQEMSFHSALAEEYLGYLDVLVNYSEFRSKMTRVFDYVFTKINEFYLKVVRLKASITSQFHDLRKIRNENPRAALIVQSIYSSMDFDEHTVEGDFDLIETKYESIRAFTKSINESRQANVAESLNTIMFWVAVISFFFGMIAFYDKYQSSETFNVAAIDAFTSTGFILLPFALLFLFIFMRNGVMFEGIARVLRLAMIRLKTSRLFFALRLNIRYKSHVADPQWAGIMEFLTTELVNSLLPQKEIAETDDLDGRTDEEEMLYVTRIKPRIRRTYHNLIKPLHYKINRLMDEKYSIKIRTRKQQFELIVSEICLFTTLNNWLLEANETRMDTELRFIDTVIMHNLYASWIKYFDADFGLISSLEHVLEEIEDFEVATLSAEYLAQDDEDFERIHRSIYKDSEHEYKDDLPGMALSTLVEMDSPFWESDAVPVYMPESYLDSSDPEDENAESRLSKLTDEAIPVIRDALWCLHVENYLEVMEEKLAKDDDE
jgi:hypothetical protein